MRRSTSALTVALILLLAACGTSDDGATATSTTTTESAAPPSDTTVVAETTEVADTTTTTTPEREPACTSYARITGLYDSLESIATGAADAQDSAQAAWDQALDSLLTNDGGTDVTLAASLSTLARLDFHVTEDPTGAPTEQELADAFTTLDGTYGATCSPEGQVGECPAPEVLEAEGYTCDSEGTLTPVEEDPAGTVQECPAPEVLEENNFTCDSDGNLTPVG